MISGTAIYYISQLADRLLSPSYNQTVQVNESIRALYKVLGHTVGRQIRDRLRHDISLDEDPKRRIELANEVIDGITALRAELQGARDFEKIFKHLDSLNLKQLAWILEAYFLLNQSSTTSAEITSDANQEYDRDFAQSIISYLEERGFGEKEFRRLFEKEFSANLVLTAHPTAGVQPDYMNHINNMVETLESIPDKADIKNFFASESSLALELKEYIELSISHMVRAKPYNEDKLLPRDESRNFLSNIEKASYLIPSKLVALEKELKRKFKSDFQLSPDFFKVHSWVARDIDGNPTVSEEEHWYSLLQEREALLLSYRDDVFRLWQSLSDDFTANPKLPRKTFFVSHDFELMFRDVISHFDDITNAHQAYRVVLQYKVLAPLERALDDLHQGNGLNSFDVQRDFIVPLSLIRENKEGLNTSDIDFLIKKAQIFGNFGSKGHTRQGNEILAELMRLMTGFKQWGDLDKKTDFLLSPEENKDYFLVARNKIEAKKDQLPKPERIYQTLSLLGMAHHGGIERQIISMNQSFEDMLNVLVINKCLHLDLEVVPLTEKISDLRSSYICTIDALLNPAWRLHLLRHKGQFIKMRGPSDSAKQNGFIAAQWEMFKSKIQDTIVVEIFNALLKAKLNGDDTDLEIWKELSKDSAVAKYTLDQFAVLNFDAELDLWRHQEINRIELVNFDGWGEPIERGGGLEFKNTVANTQPLASSLRYERTLQGGGAQQFGSAPRTRKAIKDFIEGMVELAARSSTLCASGLKDFYGSLILDEEFTDLMNSLSQILRESLRLEVFGIDVNDDEQMSDETNLRNYFRHVIKSPLIYLDHFNIASRPTSRSGSKLKELLNKEEFENDLDKMAAGLSPEEILATLADVRAIPYAAMFSLFGGNHVSFYGFANVPKKMRSKLSKYYHADDDSQEHRLVKHMIDSLEKGAFTTDINCYLKAHSMVEFASNSDYDVTKDPLAEKLIKSQAALIQFIAEIKSYGKVSQLEDLLQDDPETRDLLIARRNDAAVPRLGIAYAMAEILANAKTKSVNPLDIKNIELEHLDLLRKAFAAGASTFGNGCID